MGRRAAPNEKNGGEFAFCGFAERHEWLDQREEQREVAEIDHVHVRVYFGAAIFEAGRQWP